LSILLPSQQDRFLGVQLLASQAEAKFSRKSAKRVSQWNWKQFDNYDTKRQLKIISDLGTAALPDDKLEMVTLTLDLHLQL
jgi:hypothetical protein